MSTTAQVPDQLFSEGEVSTSPTAAHAGDQLFSDEETKAPSQAADDTEIPSDVTGFEASGQMAPKAAVDQGQKLMAAGTGAVLAAPLLSEASAPALRYIGQEWGAPAVKALEQAAESHPLVAKVLMHGLEGAGLLKLGQYMKVFGK
jgi:hypothetical protein